MPIGLFFGSFNPIHIGHLIIANHVLNVTDVKKIWFVLSPQNPFKNSAGLLNEFERLHLLQKAIADDHRLRAVDIEFNLPKPSYTATTLAYLCEKYPDQRFKILIGSDSYQNINNWKNAEYILNNYTLLVYKRPGFEVEKRSNNIQVLDAPLLEISATYIRQMIRDGKSIRYLVPHIIEEDLLSNRFFRHQNI